MKRSYLVCLFLCLTTAFNARPAQAQTETDLYDFICQEGSCPDGSFPQSRLTLDSAGNLYGTTPIGGVYGSGIVYELSPEGIETVLHNFTGGADGASPYFSPVIFDGAGNLYGTAVGGGANGDGVVFELSPTGDGWTETVLYNFADDGDGAYPQSGVVFGPTGSLFGINSAGVFELGPSVGDWTEQVIYAIQNDNAAGLTVDAVGDIFGVGPETVFELSPSDNGVWTPSVIHTFTGYPKDGFNPENPPAPDNHGNLYGTTAAGGAHGKKKGGYGTVYELSLGEAGWTETILYSFKSSPKDGSYPGGGVVLDPAGNIYGSTSAGGENRWGTVFEIAAPVGGGTYQEKVLCSFTLKADPDDTLILDSAGNLYGTTLAGNPRGYEGCGGYGCGFVFKVTP